MLLSTPDRARTRGWLDDGPLGNSAYVREWTGDEFARFLRDCGFRDIPFAGYTVDDDRAHRKITALVVSGAQARFFARQSTKQSCSDHQRL